MTLSDPTRIPVPPLGEIGRHRIRQAVFARLDAEVPAAAPPAERPARWPLVAGGVAMAAALVLFAVTRGEAPEKSPAPAISRVVTNESGSRVSIDGAILDVAAASSLLVSQSGGAVTILLEAGAVECQVAPRQAPFAVLAAEVRVEVIGTRFTVRRAGEEVRVTVAEGTVRVTHGADTSLVSAGAVWPEPAPPPAEPAVDESAYDMDPMRLDRKAARAPAPEAPPPPQAPSARERYEAALALEATQVEQAIALYRALGAEGGAWGANALFAEARLELERGRRARARRLLDRYLERHPGGPNASLARALLRDLR
jgi:hypothetical protein